MLLFTTFAAFFKRPPVWHIRRVQPEHAGAVSALHRMSFSRGWQEDEVFALIRDSAVHGDILCRAGNIDGFILSRCAAGEAELLTIALAKGQRGRGGGNMLLRQHLGHLLGLGIERVVLEVDETNLPAHKLYRRFGFEDVGTRPAYYLNANGTRGNARIMALRLG
jgi:ribosomal-protein-alanine N-acetyltransferase